MPNYELLYHIMVDASEKAIEQIEQQNYGAAKELLIKGERNAEEIYVNGSDGIFADWACRLR